MSNLFNLSTILDILRQGYHDFIGVDLNQVQYPDIALAIQVAIVVISLVLIKLLFILFGRKKHTWVDSGHLFYDLDGERENVKKGFLPRAISFFPKIILAVPLAAILLAMADPFLSDIREEKRIVETRTRIDLKDVSGSMGYNFGEIPIPKAKLAMDAHLKFLDMRKGKGDRTSFWIFSDNGYKIQSFTTDDDLYYLQVYDAPWELGGSSPDNVKWEDLPNYPRSRYSQKNGEGGTTLSRVLRDVIQQFDSDEEKQKKSIYYRLNTRRAVLIVTDAEISDANDTRAMIKELRQRNIVIYIILINPSAVAGATNTLVQDVINSGGAYFPVADSNSLGQAYQVIDKLEKVKIQIEKKTFKIPLRDRFIFISILLMIVIVPVGMIAHLFFSDYP